LKLKNIRPLTLTELDNNEIDGAVAIILEKVDWKELN
jgi:hypothetical protein